ncbi:MAG: M48 family metallopeptidase [Cytophagales bacterium]|nr:M48 family metallopeptidase [Cytophagales bacterium]
MLTPSYLFTLCFSAALLGGFLVRSYLSLRQAKHVAAHRGAVPKAFANKVSQANHEKAADYTLAKSRLGFWEDVLGCVVLLGWTLLGGLALQNAALIEWLGAGFGQQMALLVTFTVIGSVIELPLSLYQTFGLEARFGFNKMTWKTWAIDLVKGTLLGAAIGLPLVALVLYLMGAAGQLWWLWAWGALTVFSLFMMWIAPTVIMPLFNKFTPLEDEALKARVAALMQRCGFNASGFFVMDGSKRSAHSNAFFVGFGGTKRVVFYDTLLKQINHDEMEAVLAHELGHAHHKHIIKRMVLQFVVSFAGFALLGWLATQTWFYTGLGVQPSMTGSNDALALLLFMIAVPVFMFFVTPVFSYFSRKDEFEADAYAVKHSNGAALASALLTLYEDNASTLTPDPLYMRFYASHPPATERLARLTA